MRKIGLRTEFHRLPFERAIPIGVFFVVLALTPMNSIGRDDVSGVVGPETVLRSKSESEHPSYLNLVLKNSLRVLFTIRGQEDELGVRVIDGAIPDLIRIYRENRSGASHRRDCIVMRQSNDGALLFETCGPSIYGTLFDNPGARPTEGSLLKFGRLVNERLLSDFRELKRLALSDALRARSVESYSRLIAEFPGLPKMVGELSGTKEAIEHLQAERTFESSKIAWRLGRLSGLSTPNLFEGLLSHPGIKCPELLEIRSELRTRSSPETGLDLAGQVLDRMRASNEWLCHVVAFSESNVLGDAASAAELAVQTDNWRSMYARIVELPSSGREIAESALVSRLRELGDSKGFLSAYLISREQRDLYTAEKVAVSTSERSAVEWEWLRLSEPIKSFDVRGAFLQAGKEIKFERMGTLLAQVAASEISLAMKAEVQVNRWGRIPQHGTYKVVLEMGVDINIRARVSLLGGRPISQSSVNTLRHREELLLGPKNRYRGTTTTRFAIPAEIRGRSVGGLVKMQIEKVGVVNPMIRIVEVSPTDPSIFPN